MAAPTGSELRIDPATIDDVPTVLRLIEALADYEKLRHEVVATEALLRDAFFGEKPVAEALIARVGAEPVGFAVFFHSFSTFLARRGMYLEDIFVLPAWRRRGFGRQILAHVARLAVERGCGRLEWSVLDWNEPAIEFYRSLSARAMDEWTVFRLTGPALQALAEATPATNT